MYYSMMLFPLLMSVVLKNSVMRNWPAWLAVYGFMSYDSWLSSRFIEAGRTAEYMKTTLGWSLMLLVVFGVLTVRYVSARREGRLDRGIDPAFLLEPHEKAAPTSRRGNRKRTSSRRSSRPPPKRRPRHAPGVAAGIGETY